MRDWNYINIFHANLLHLLSIKSITAGCIRISYKIIYYFIMLCMIVNCIATSILCFQYPQHTSKLIFFLAEYHHYHQPSLQERIMHFSDVLSINVSSTASVASYSKKVRAGRRIYCADATCIIMELHIQVLSLMHYFHLHFLGA